MEDAREQQLAEAFANLLDRRADGDPDTSTLFPELAGELEAVASIDRTLAPPAALPERLSGHKIIAEIGSGNVAGQIEGYAEKAGADLIVVGEPAGRSANDLLYGTFAARVVQHSYCPVLTVNRPAAKRAARIANQEHKTDAVWANQ